jgi:hypothetical protein
MKMKINIQEGRAAWLGARFMAEVMVSAWRVRSEVAVS